MKHFTSYYANYKNIPKNYLCIGISRKCPEWFANNSESLGNFLFVKNNFLAPSEKLLNGAKNGSIDISEYKKIYIEELFYRTTVEMKYKDIVDFINQIDSFYSTCSTPYDGLVFMCYESPHEFCHRHLFRRLLTNIYHIDCEEFGVKDIDTWGYKGPINQTQESANIPLFE